MSDDLGWFPGMRSHPEPEDPQRALRAGQFWGARQLASAGLLSALAALVICGMGYLVCSIGYDVWIRANGAPALATVDAGVPGESCTLHVSVGDQNLIVEVRSWTGVPLRSDGLLDIVIDPRHPGSLDGTGSPWLDDDFYGRAVLAREPHATDQLWQALGALPVGGIMVAIALSAYPVGSPRLLLAVARDQAGVPATVTAWRQPARRLPLARRVGLAVLAPKMHRRVALDAHVRTDGGSLVIPVVVTVSNYPGRSDGHTDLVNRRVLLIGQAWPGGRVVLEPLLASDRQPWWRRHMIWAYGPARAEVGQQR